MNFKKVLISELKPAAYNPRKNLSEKDPEYQRIKKSIETFGYVDPVIVNSDYTVIGGHQRLKVLKEMGEASIDVVVVDLPKEQEKALNVALNKITGDWDFQQLSIVLSELKEADFDISITGFTDKELKDIDVDLFGKKIYTPEIGASAVTPSDINDAARKLEQVTGKPPKVIEAFCPKCGHEFEIRG